MKHVRKSVLVPYTPQQIYGLVTDIEAYPGFLPWCDSASVLERSGDSVVARLGLSYMGVRQSFTTRNQNTAAESVVMKLVDGPFSHLEGTWRFHALGRAGSAPQGCKVAFDLRYALAGGALEVVLSPVFDKVANTFVDSFVKRAESVHGSR